MKTIISILILLFIAMPATGEDMDKAPDVYWGNVTELGTAIDMEAWSGPTAIVFANGINANEEWLKISWDDNGKIDVKLSDKVEMTEAAKRFFEFIAREAGNYKLVKETP